MKTNKSVLHKLTISIICLLLFHNILADEKVNNPNSPGDSELGSFVAMATADENLETDTNIDVTSYHLSIDINIEAKSITGSTEISFLPTVNGLNQVKLNLQRAMIVSSVSGNAASFTSADDILTITLDNNYNIGTTVTIGINYSGTPVLATGSSIDKGFRFDTHSTTVPAISTISTPFLSHYWFPCKDGPYDKADKIMVDITIPESSYNGYDLMAVSNGTLTGTSTTNGKKTFNWEHNYPIAPYYIMVAVSNYRTIEGTYANGNNNFPLIYYVFPTDYEQASGVVANIPSALDVFIDLFGDYPYEKYGMTQIAPSWAVENQTNPIMGSMAESWFDDMIHELSHSWFGNSITNETWQNVWLNEGFGTYAVALYKESTQGTAAYHNYMNSLGNRWNKTQSLYLDDDSDYSTIFSNVYYDKGAWVLHMLRYRLGDEVFFNLIKSYAQSVQFKHKNVNTTNFITYCETSSGVNLQTFFNQWVYETGFPAFSYNFYSTPSESKAGVTISQTQSVTGDFPEVFETYLDLKFTFSDGTTQTEKVLNNAKTQTFEFAYSKLVTNVEIDPDQWIIRTVSNSEKEILSFTIPNQTSSVIDKTNHTIAVTLPYGTVLSALVPVITISNNATISPASAIATDFTSGSVTYTVTAQDLTTQTYSVSVVTAANNEKKINSLTITGQVGVSQINQENHTIVVTMPYGTTLSALVPVITISVNATVSPNSGVAQNFTSESITYTVTAQDMTTQTYSVSVVTAANNEKKINSLTIAGQVGESQIDHLNHTVVVTMPYGTVLSSLTPVITLSADATISPNSGVAQNFTSGSITYTVKAQNLTTQYYSVSVVYAPNTEKKINSFTIAGQVGDSQIDNVNHTVLVTMPYGTILSSLTPLITLSANASVSPNSGVAWNFTSGSVTYTVTAQDLTTQAYKVSVVYAANTEKKIISFTIAGQVGVSQIDHVNHTVVVTMPYGTILSSLTPVITLSANATASPNSGVAQNFASGSITYTVTAQNLTTQTYSASVVFAPNTEKKINSFTIAGQVGDSQIDHVNHTVLVTMPFGTDKSALAPVISVSDNATVSPGSGVAQSFSAGAVTYKVTAEDLTTTDYAVTVSNAQNYQNDILTFTIIDQVGETVINQTAKTVYILMPSTAIISSLTPVITVSANATITPASGVSTDFSGNVVYTVTSESGIPQAWTITVTKEKPNAVPETTETNISAYPNPTTGIIKVNSNILIKTINVYMLNGALMNTINYDGLNSFNIDLSDYESGIYLLKLTAVDNSITMMKIVVIDK